MPSATACAPTSTSSPADDPDDFLLLLQDLLDRFHPVGADEETLVLRIAADQWRLDRAFPMEARIFRDLFYDVAEQDKARQRRYAGEKKDAEEDGDPVPPAPIPPEEGDLLARAFNIDCAGPNSFSKLARYESSIERSIDRCLRQLQKFQAARNNPPASGPQTDPEPPQHPQKPKITKRTQKMRVVQPQAGVSTPAPPRQRIAPSKHRRRVPTLARRARQRNTTPAPDPCPRRAKRAMVIESDRP